MGTTQRLIPGVPSEPNWKQLNYTITALANTIKSEQETEANLIQAVAKGEQTPSEANAELVKRIQARQNTLRHRGIHHVQSAMQALIRTAGGRESMAKGRSRSLGHAGLQTAKKITGFFVQVAGGGLAGFMKEIGFGSLKGKTAREIVDFLLVYFSDASVGMDEVAANMAFCQLFEQLCKDCKAVEALEDKLRSFLGEDSISEFIITFYGLYLFEHLSQRFQEKIAQIRGEDVSKETFVQIKEDILGQLRVLHHDQSIMDMEWKGAAGKVFEEKIFDSIIKIFE